MKSARLYVYALSAFEWHETITVIDDTETYIQPSKTLSTLTRPRETMPPPPQNTLMAQSH